MTNIFDIKDYNALYAAYGRLKTEGNKTTSADNSKSVFGQNIDIDGDKTAEIWEFMQSVNLAKKAKIFNEVDLFKRSEGIRTSQISADNPIHIVLALEGFNVDHDKVSMSYKKIDEIIKYSKENIPENISPSQKLQYFYKILKDEFGYIYNQKAELIDGIDEDLLLTDCDTSSFIYLAVAHELGWPLQLVLTYNHALVKWQKSNGEYFYFETTDGSLVDDRIKIKNYDKTSRIVTAENKNSLTALVYNNVAAEQTHRNYIDKTKEAVIMLKRAAELDPELANIYANLAAAYKALNEDRKALEYFIQAAKKDPHLLWHDYIGGIDNNFLDTMPKDTVPDDTKDYIRKYERLIFRNDKDASAYFNRGSAYLSDYLYDKAISDFSKSIELDPKYGAAYNNRGLAHVYSGKYEEAVDDFNKAILFENNNVNAYINMGNMHMKSAEFSYAIQRYLTAVISDIDSDTKSSCFEWIGNAYVHLGMYDDAIINYKRAIRQCWYNVTAYDNLSAVYGIKGDMGKAHYYDRQVKEVLKRDLPPKEERIKNK